MLLILEKRRLQGDLTAAFQDLKGCKKDGQGLSKGYVVTEQVGMKEGAFRLDTVKKFFTVGSWGRLPREFVDAVLWKC